MVVLVFDNQKYTPQCKAACQAKRRTRAKQLPTDIKIGMREELPEDWYALMATTKLRLRMFAFLLEELQKRLRSILPHELPEGAAVYCSPPFLEYARSTIDPTVMQDTLEHKTAYLQGDPLEMTETNLLPSLPTIQQGEGDLLCKVWAEHLAAHLPRRASQKAEDTRIMVKSKDWDTVCAFLTTPPQCQVRVHVGDIKPKKSTDRKKLEFVNINEFYKTVFKDNQQLAVNYVLGNILSGSDYCEGVYGLSGRAMLRTLLQMPASAHAVNISGRNVQISRKRLHGWLQKSKRGQKPVRLQPRMMKRAVWNLVYWLQLRKIPDPIEYGGWDYERNGTLMPVLDTLK